MFTLERFEIQREQLAGLWFDMNNCQPGCMTWGTWGLWEDGSSSVYTTVTSSYLWSSPKLGVLSSHRAPVACFFSSASHLLVWDLGSGSEKSSSAMLEVSAKEPLSLWEWMCFCLANPSELWWNLHPHVWLITQNVCKWEVEPFLPSSTDPALDNPFTLKPASTSPAVDAQIEEKGVLVSLHLSAFDCISSGSVRLVCNNPFVSLSLCFN